MKRVGWVKSRAENGLVALQFPDFTGFEVARCWWTEKNRHKAAGILDRTVHGDDITAIQGFGMDIGGPTTRACSPGLHILPLQGSPMGIEPTVVISGSLFRWAVSPACCSPGWRPGKRNTPKTVQTALQGQNRSPNSPTHDAQHRHISPQDSNHTLPHPQPPNTWLNPSCTRDSQNFDPG